ncbi:AAA family ATPase [Marinoscillum sp.]|uniref:cytidylate kinase-like family protein n=1 Tax=Marinoscillum sp. TaxID=2024838 RepID=UPI003BA98FAE
MKVNLKNYMEEREKNLHKPTISGPVLTISRSYGCDEHPLVNSLILHLNQLRDHGLKKHTWSYINQEVIEETAKALHMQPYDVEARVMAHTEKTNDWLSGFNSRKTVSDSIILETIKDIMVTFARKGNVIFVGRGGMNVLRSIPNSLHVKVSAPRDYRVGQVVNQMKMNPRDAEDMIRSIDKQRKNWRNI